MVSLGQDVGAQVGTADERLEDYVRARRNWGRWGADDQVGTINLVTPEKRARAATLVRSGRLVSLSRPFPTALATDDPQPAQHFMKRIDKPTGGFALDYIGVDYHGRACTHLDALCHLWGEDGMWNGRDPDDEITFDGARFGGVDYWGEGIVTRGVLLDVPRYRGEPYVTADKPVHGSELEAIAKASRIELEPGDAIAVYCGRELFDRARASHPAPAGPRSAPGLHGSCLRFLRECDAAVLLWDMMDATPADGPGVHGAIANFGLALVDNALLEPLSVACAEEGRYEFQLSLAPLRIIGGTGSPINPLALL